MGCSTEQTVPRLIQTNLYLRQLGSSQITSWVSSMMNHLQYCSGPHFLITSGNQETVLALQRDGDIPEFPAKKELSVSFRIDGAMSSIHHGEAELFLTGFSIKNLISLQMRQ